LAVGRRLRLGAAPRIGPAHPQRARAYLERIGYYRLSGYWYPFRESITTTGTDGGPVTIATDTFVPEPSSATPSTSMFSTRSSGCRYSMQSSASRLNKMACYLDRYFSLARRRHHYIQFYQ
jgi:hypothetical protein